MAKNDSLFTRLFYAGVGLGAITVEKIEESINQLLKKSNKPLDEFKDSINKMVKDLATKKAELQDEMNEYITKLAENLKFAKQSDLEEILKRIEELENLLNEKINGKNKK